MEQKGCRLPIELGNLQSSRSHAYETSESEIIERFCKTIRREQGRDKQLIFAIVHFGKHKGLTLGNFISRPPLYNKFICVQIICDLYQSSL